MDLYRPLNDRALEAFDVLSARGVAAPTVQADPFLACFRGEDDRRGLLDELHAMQAAGQKIDFELLDSAQARALEPTLSEHVGAALLLRGQRFINPPAYLDALADAVRARGAAIHEQLEVRKIRDVDQGVILQSATHDHRYDAVVVATGAWLNSLTRPFGVRRPVQAGRGYSFSVSVKRMPAGPIYLPAERVACTPLNGRLRIAGMMEFRGPDEPLDPRRIRAIANAVQPYLRDVDLSDRRDEWVGSRPCTPDGLPMIGRTTSPRVFVAGGLGMWGVVFGPRTGELLSEVVMTGRTPPELAAFDPLRAGRVGTWD